MMLSHYLQLPTHLSSSLLSFLPSLFNFPTLLIFLGTSPTLFFFFYPQLAHHQNLAVKSLIKVLRLMRFLTHSHLPSEKSLHSSSQLSFVLPFPSGGSGLANDIRCPAVWKDWRASSEPGSLQLRLFQEACLHVLLAA